ncbi:2Fe-2S iron-sulfur cluster-binding protein [Thiolinea disciformis]|uniref:2Fe-2S iron-sulfur cluster-binding protein n=1 Tax=Thiolinea disciformis TaxID=125614 RepID=UPI00036C570A|nr:2Fe-2S iron-sulfur cluster-binding protein [Thiolinea disciformis]
MTFTIQITDSGDSFPCKPNEMLLLAMVRLGRKGIPVGCRNGGCGVCKVHVKSGEYSNGKMSRAHVTEQEEQDGYALACRCQPSSDLVIEVVGKMRKAVHPEQAVVIKTERGE